MRFKNIAGRISLLNFVQTGWTEERRAEYFLWSAKVFLSNAKVILLSAKVILRSARMD